MLVISEAGEAMTADPEWSDAITEKPELLGVDRFTEAGTVIRLIVRTQPDRYFALRRELLRRVKRRLDEENIRLAVPGRRLVVSPETPREGAPG